MKSDLVLNEKSTTRFIEQREQERMNRYDLEAIVQTKVNIDIFQRVCPMNFDNKHKFNPVCMKFAKKVIKNFVDQIPEISSDYTSVLDERNFIKVKSFEY